MTSIKRRVTAVLTPAVTGALRRRTGRLDPWDQRYEYRGDEPGRAPDFIGLGAQKSGTTWWFSELRRHPRVDVSSLPHKELHFFSKGWAADAPELAAYHRQFTAPADRVTGEWTPDYLVQPWVPQLLAEQVPDARLLVLLRDPVERFVSGVTHTMQRQDDVVADVVEDAVQRSLYGQQLQRLFACVDRDRVLVQQFEQARDDPDRELARTQAFLGLTTAPASTGDRRTHPTRIAKYEPPPAVLADLGRRLAADRALLRELVGDLDLELDLDRWSRPWT